MKLDQLYYSITKQNIHYQNVKKELDALKNFLQDNQVKADSAIDIGCGNGLITEKIKKLLGLKTISGLDLNKELLRQAEKRGIKIIEGDMELANLKEKFDLVICYGSLHHARNTDEFAASLKSLSDKYMLIVDNTVRKNIYHKITGSKHFPLESSPYHIRSQEEITAALEKNGCRVVAVKTNKNANIWHDRSFILATV